MQDHSVQKVMTSNLFTVNTNDSVSKIAHLFKEHSFHHIPVVNEEGSLEGMVSRTDLDRTKSGATLFRNPKKEEYDEALFRSMRACEIMTRDVVALQSTDSIRQAYEIFKKNKFRALPVIGKGKLIGLVTPLDILNYFFK